MTLRNKLAMAVTVVSLLFFFPGIFLPMLTIDMESGLKSNIANMTVPILYKSNSILHTVVELWDQKVRLVALLIFLFSVVVPMAKAALIVYAALTPNLGFANRSMSIVKSIGKWSMCDVFVVAIFLTYLSTTSGPTTSSHEVFVMGFKISLDVAVQIQSQLETGFYCFLAYCLLSLAALQIYEERN